MRHARATLICLWLGFTPAAVAQVSVGFTGGVTWSGMTGSFVDGSGRELGSVIGLNAEYQIGRLWVLDAEFNLTQKGADDLRLPTSAELIDFRHKYLEVPILLHHVFRLPGGRFAVHPYAGGAVGLNVGCDLRYEDSFTFEPCEEATPGGLGRRVDASVVIGVAFRRRFGGLSTISLESRLSLGLTTVSEEAHAGGLSARNNVVHVLFSFGLPLGRWGVS